ncbi:hypothetical protein BDF21DRAFT_455458 [Thamnidium elegans]|nr:hypothetical protein BDF21DRAFT_455458 [Thamnidium elegans]
MSQETSYTRQRSYSSSNSNSTPKPPRGPDGPSYSSTSPKTGHRYSSSANGKLTRHYATPEESEAVIPVFSTPTHMYIRQELNAQPRGSPVYTASPKYTAPTATPTTQPYSPSQQQQQQQQKQTLSGNAKNFAASGYQEPTKPSGSPLAYGRTRAESATRPTTDRFGSDSTGAHSTQSGNQPTSQADIKKKNVSQKDMLLAQLVDMGFSLEASKIAMTASGGTNLQEILDILVQNAKVENQFPHHQTPPPPPPSSNPRPTSQPPQPPPHASNPRPTSQPPPPSTNPRPTPQPQPRPTSDDDDEEDPRLEREKEEKFKQEQEERRREYFDQLKREKPIPPTPSPRPPAEPVSAYADRERKQGNFLFNKGQYNEAEACYSAAITSLPPGHSELVLLCNNRAAARLKLQKYHECLADCALAIDIARSQMAYSAVLGDTIWKGQMIKALHRKASALEGLCLFETAIQVYEEYVRFDGSRSAQAAQGIARCQQAILEKRQAPTTTQQQHPPPQPPRPANGPSWKPANDNSAFPDIDFNMFIPKQTPEQLAAQAEINKSKAVKEMREREKMKEAEDAERLRNEDSVNAKIMAWKAGKDRNLRALLGSLGAILWPGVQWKSVQMRELIEPRKCKVTYMKAIAKVHPDKLPANATVEQHIKDFSSPQFNAKSWINSVLKPTPLTAQDDGGAKDTTILVTKLQMVSETTSRQFDQLSTSVLKSMPRILYDLKVIADAAKSTHQGIEGVKKNLGLIEGESALEKLRKPHIAKTRMEECRLLLLEKSNELQQHEREKEALESLMRQEQENEQRELQEKLEQQEREEKELRELRQEEEEKEEDKKKEEEVPVIKESVEEVVEEKKMDEGLEYGHVQLPPLRSTPRRIPTPMPLPSNNNNNNNTEDSYLQQIQESVTSNMFKRIGVPLDKFWQS